MLLYRLYLSAFYPVTAFLSVEGLYFVGNEIFETEHLSNKVKESAELTLRY